MSDLRVYRQARFQLSLGVITLWFVIGVRPSVSVPLLGGSGGGELAMGVHFGMTCLNVRHA